MSRSRTAFLSGTITDNPLSAAATTINSAALANLPAIASPDIAVLVLDPAGSAGAPEVVYVTAHTGSATSATISRAQEGTSAREHASTIPWVHGPTTYDLKGWRLEGSNTVEGTSTSTSVADIVTVSGLLIPTTQPFRIKWSGRKSAGAAAAARLGLKINSTVIVDSEALQNLGTFSAADRAETLAGFVEYNPRSTNYLYGGYGIYGGRLISPVLIKATGNDAIPNVTITSITITGITDSASVTVAVKDVFVEVMDT